MKNIIKAGFAFSVIAALVAATLVSAARTGMAAQDNKMMGAAAVQDKSLYERLGGEAAISAVIDDFVGRVAADSRVNQKFAKSNIDRVKIELKSFVCQATGGPCKYMGNSMPKAHKNMKVTEGEFNALVEDLVATLDKFNVPAKEKGELLGALGPLKSQIVEVNGDATGTPLPADFKPAPPLTDKQKKEATAMGGDKSKSKM
ncbi:MAG TPA: group 1 truncated hemoglobin [Pyrinomonadaceae bacterium]|nr:group 1 truncated hemoglobin [Pyrinomonadaceae bacterium]